jgi:hypothetical protein
VTCKACEFPRGGVRVSAEPDDELEDGDGS